MNKHYTKPDISILSGYSEGVYAASGAGEAGNLSVGGEFVFDRWDGGGKKFYTASWSGLNGTVTLQLHFNDTIDDATADGDGAQAHISGQTVTITFDGSTANSMPIGIHINHGTSIDHLQLLNFNYSV